MDLKKYIGIQVRLGRQKAGLTQEQLAERVEKAVETISNIERGFAYTGLETLERISQVLEVPLRDFFEGADQRSISRARLEIEDSLMGLSKDLSDRELRVALDLVRSLREHRS